MKLFLVLSFMNYNFYACLVAVRRASARQATLSYLVLIEEGLRLERFQNVLNFMEGTESF
jgi:hypothetical protein